jgi:hypothetical protein
MSRRLKLRLLYYATLIWVGATAWWVTELLNRGAQ